MSKENKKSSQNNTAIIVALCAALVAGVLVLVIALGSVFSDGSGNDGSTAYIVSTTEKVNGEDDGVDDIFGNDNVVEEGTVADQNPNNGLSENNSGSGNNVIVDDKNENETKNQAVEYYEQLSPNGENKLSDHHNNKYIKKISSEYNVDSDLLVAIYSEPDTRNNFVLQFSGKKDSNGNVIKSPATLEKVYQIDKNGKVCIATGQKTGNVGVSYAEGVLCFNMVKTLVMTQYPEYFTGLE